MQKNTRTDRLQALRYEKGYSQEEIARLTGIPKGSYAGYEWNNDATIPKKRLTAIAKVLEVSEEYILHGEKEYSDQINPMPPKIIYVETSTKQEKIAFVPEPAQAGYLKKHNDLDYLRTLPTYSLPGFNNGSYRMFPVAGDSMTPTLNDKDVVITEYVEHWSDMKDNEIYVLVTNEGILIKRCINAIAKRQSIIINSDNPDYSTDFIPMAHILEIWKYKKRLTS